MSLKQNISTLGYDFAMLPRGFKEEISYLDMLERRIAASESELDDSSTDEDRALIDEAKNNYEDRKRELLVDLKEWKESKETKVEAKPARQKKAAAPKADEPKADEPTTDPKPVDTPTPDDQKQDKDDETSGGGLAGYIIGGIALLATFGAINYFRRR
jgi:DNA replication initiation complex subunit (GINS family)